MTSGSSGTTPTKRRRARPPDHHQGAGWAMLASRHMLGCRCGQISMRCSTTKDPASAGLSFGSQDDLLHAATHAHAVHYDPATSGGNRTYDRCAMRPDTT